jgi:hypothetical protein
MRHKSGEQYASGDASSGAHPEYRGPRHCEDLSEYEKELETPQSRASL